MHVDKLAQGCKCWAARGSVTIDPIPVHGIADTGESFGLHKWQIDREYQIYNSVTNLTRLHGFRPSVLDRDRHLNHSPKD